MLRTVLLLSSICGLVKSSGIAVAPHAPAGLVAAVGPPRTTIENAPFVTAASSQYFQRTFNRLVVPPVVAPVAPVASPPIASVFPAVAAPTVFVEPTRTIPVAVNPQPPIPPPEAVQPNVAIAVATAHAAAPVATILLPPYPFGFPPNFGLVPSEQPINIPDENAKEPTTQRTTESEVTTTSKPTTPIDVSSSDNNIVQALPSNENVNFNLYGPPSQESRPQFQPLPESQNPGRQYQNQQPNLQFQPQQPVSQFQSQRPNLQFQPQTVPQIQPKQPNLPLPNHLQTSTVQVHPQQSKTQFQVQRPEFPPYPPNQLVVPQKHPQQGSQLQSSSQYLPPQQQPLWKQQKGKPQKIRTSVEVVPVPLAYITPPPLHKTHGHVKVVKHVYSFVPASSAKIVLKPVKIRPVRLVKHKIVGVRLQNIRAQDRDIEITTFNPFRRPNTKPPKV